MMYDKESIITFSGENAFLSNFYEKPFEYKGYTFFSSEHAYQSSKANNFEDFISIVNSTTPEKAKRLGQMVDLKPDFNKNKILIMRSILIAKFKDKKLKQMLMSTCNNVLIEGNYWHDNFWGKCFCSKCENVKGLNHLGKLLMKIRASFL